jgi:parallel beta-helix repeat protein
MSRRQLSGLLGFLLLAFVFVATIRFNARAQASGPIYIKADGSIDPPTAPIFTLDKVTYTLTGNISSDSDGLIVQKNGIVVDGAGYTLLGTLSGTGIDLSGTSGVTIRNIRVEAFYNGVYLASSDHSMITRTNLTGNSNAGLELDSSPNNIISGNSLVNNFEGVWLFYFSDSNSISGNNITANVLDGVYVYSSSNNDISANLIANNGYGTSIHYSSGNSFSHNSFVDNTNQVYSESSTNIWNEDYPSGGNYWSDYTSADYKCGPSQDHPGSDGIGDMPYVIDISNQDNYPLMNPWTPPTGHNVAIISAVSSKVVIDQGLTGNLTVYGANRGEYSETFNVTVYVNTTSVGSVALPLESSSTINITLSWNTTGFAKGNYIISAYAWPVPGETDKSDNNFTGGWVVVSIVGDLTGGTSNVWDFVPDGKCDGKDVSVAAKCFGSYPGCLPPLIWNANCDVNNDGKVDGKDIAIVARHFGEHYP